MADPFAPQKSDKFTFGLWTVGNRGADPFGPVVRPHTTAPKIVEKLAKLGAYGVSLHDNDLIPHGSADAEQRMKDFEKALKDNDMVVAMGTTNLFSHPIFRDGAFTNPDPAIRRYALQKTAASIEAGKLFHVDLNAQKIGRFDQDHRFGSEDYKGSFFLVKLLEESGYEGPRHFDAHAYRTEDMDGVWEFAKGNMRTYKILAQKVKLFAKDKATQGRIHQ